MIYNNNNNNNNNNNSNTKKRSTSIHVGVVEEIAKCLLLVI